MFLFWEMKRYTVRGMEERRESESRQGGRQEDRGAARFLYNGSFKDTSFANQCKAGWLGRPFLSIQ